MVVTDVRNILTADSAVTALVADRIEPVRLDQATGLPAVVVTLISTVPANHLNGRPNLDENRVQLDCFATTYLSARQVADACRAALETAGAALENDFDNFEPDVTEYRITQDYLFWT